MRVLTGLIVALLFGASVAAETNDPVLAEVKTRDAELAAAHGRGDMATYRAGLSERYVYIDIAGKRVTVDTLAGRREDDLRRLVSSAESEEEAVRLADSVVLLRGLSHSVAAYYGGLPRVSTTRWSSLWVREGDGVWRLTADTATPVKSGKELPFVHVPQPDATLDHLIGRWTLSLEPSMDLLLTADDGNLIGTLAGQPARFTFRPASGTHFFADERPFELRFTPDGQSLSFVTWGTPIAATRVVEAR